MATNMGQNNYFRKSHPIRQQKKHRYDQISTIQQNLKLMKSEAEQFLKKGNKQLPPITKARHYLYLNFSNEHLMLAEQTNANRKNFKENQNQAIHKVQSIKQKKSFQKSNRQSRKFLSFAKKFPLQIQQIITTKRKKNQPIQISQELASIEINKAIEKSSELSQNKDTLKSYRNFQTSKFTNTQTVRKKQADNQPSQINRSIVSFKKIQQKSGNMIQSLQLDAFPSYLNKNQNFTTPESPTAKNHFQDNLINIKNKESQKFKDQNKGSQDKLRKFLSAAKIIVKQKPKSTKQNPFDKKIPVSKIKKFKDQNSILDCLFAPTKNVLNHSEKKKESKPKLSQLLSSDCINVPKDHENIIINIAKQETSSFQFSPLRSIFQLKKQDLDSFLKFNQGKFSHQIPKALESIPLKYKKMWVEQFQYQYQNLSQRKFSSLDKDFKLSLGDANKTYETWKKSIPITKTTVRHSNRKPISELIQPDHQQWQPWKNDDYNEKAYVENFEQNSTNFK